MKKNETTNIEHLFKIDENDEHFLYIMGKNNQIFAKKRKEKILNIVDRKGFEIRI